MPNPGSNPINNTTQSSSNINKSSSSKDDKSKSLGTTSLGAYNELDFLTWIRISNNDNKDDIWNKTQGSSIQDGQFVPASETVYVVYKDPKNIGTNKIKKHYSEIDNGGDLNSYSKLLIDFSGAGKNTYKALSFHAADFTYLKDLGVYTMNRMWVLRRYDDNVVVPNNLTDWGDANVPSPKSTVVGWIKPEDEQLLNIGFNETWDKTTRRIDQVLGDIMDKEFNIKTEMGVSIPGWSQGILFAFLDAMGLSDDYSSTKVPMGDPNALGEAATRLSSVEGQKHGLMSPFNMQLETIYEQKFIGDVDPGSAMLDIIRNLIYMGTSDVNYILDGTSDVIKSLFAAVTKDGGSSPEAWWKFIKVFVTAFFKAISDLFDKLVNTEGDVTSDAGQKKKNLESGKAENFKLDGVTYIKGFKEGTKDVIYLKNETGDTNKGTTIKAKEFADKKAIYYKENPEQVNAAAQAQKSKFGDLSEGAKYDKTNALQTILASTVAKHKWPLIGGIGLMTGQNTTPWHLTIGNPYSPFFNVGNIIVDKVDLKFNNEFAYNDIPTRVTATIGVSFGRNLGAQEIFSVFNNGYRRQYRKDSTGTTVPVKNFVAPSKTNEK